MAVNDLTQGKVSRQILGLFFPMLLTNMLQQMYNIVDTIIVGKGISDNALAAVGNMSSMTFLIFGFSMGLANGFSVIIAQYFGAKDYTQLRRSVASSIILSGTIGLLLTVLSIVGLEPILHLLRTDSAILHDGLTYGYLMFGGLLATVAYNLCSCILRALGDSKTPFVAIILSTIVNITLDCVFVFVLKMGVAGAAIATIIAQIVSVAVCMYKLCRIEILALHREDFRSGVAIFGLLLKNGLPMAFMNSVTAVGCMVVQYFVNGLGVLYTTAYSACSKYINLFMQPACTAGHTMTAFVSQNYGAKDFKRIRKGLHVGLAIAGITYATLGMLMVIIPHQLAGLILSGADSIEITVPFLRVCGVFIFGVDFLFIFRNACQGLAKPVIPMISGILEMVLRIGVIAMFINRTGFIATAYAEVAAWLGALLLNFIAYRYYYAKERARVKATASHSRGDDSIVGYACP